MTTITRAHVNITVLRHWIAITLGLGSRPRRRHAAARDVWWTLPLHYAVALLIWTRDGRVDRSALGRWPRALAALAVAGLVTWGLA